MVKFHTLCKSQNNLSNVDTWPGGRGFLLEPRVISLGCFRIRTNESANDPKPSRWREWRVPSPALTAWETTWLWWPAAVDVDVLSVIVLIIAFIFRLDLLENLFKTSKELWRRWKKRTSRECRPLSGLKIRKLRLLFIFSYLQSRDHTLIIVSTLFWLTVLRPLEEKLSEMMVRILLQ